MVKIAMKKIIAVLTAFMVTTGLCSCSNNIEQVQQLEKTDTAASSIVTASSFSADEMFSDKDYKADYDSFATVELADGKTSADGNGVTVNGDIVTVNSAGAYLFKGTLSNGQIVIDVRDDEKVQLIFDNVDIISAGSAAVYVKNGDKVFVVLKENSMNKLASKGEYVQSDENNVDSAVFSKSDITFTGSGSAEITSENGHGIVSKDDLKFTGGNYNITSAKKALSANDRLCFDGGYYVLKSGTDGVHCENTENAELGIIYVKSGEFDITSENDCIDGSGTVTLAGGSFKMVSGGGSVNAPKKAENSFGRFGGMREFENTADDESTESYKAVKSNTAIVITGGDFAIDSADDAVHSNEMISVSGGSFNINAGDDAFHADDTLEISDGSIKIENCYEGLEASVVNVSGGEIDLNASDDGMNASGGNDQMHYDKFAGDADACINISGGSLKIRADGDGIDSNGCLNVSGGETFISGPFGTGNGAMDYQTTGSISGGVFAAVGSSEMSMNFDSNSVQCSVLHRFSSNHNAGDEITLADSSGNVIVSFIPENKYQSAVVSSPDLKQGEKYTLTAGDESTEIEFTDIIVGEGTGIMGFGGGMGGGRGNRFNNDVFGNKNSRQEGGKAMGELPEMPENMPEFNMGERPAIPQDGMGEPPEMPEGMLDFNAEKRPEKPLQTE